MTPEPKETKEVLPALDQEKVYEMFMREYERNHDDEYYGDDYETPYLSTDDPLPF